MVRRINASSSSRLLWAVPCLALCATVAPMVAPAQSLDSAQSSGAARSTFVVAPAIALDAAPTSVAVGDLNGDGRPDMVITKKGSGSVTVFLGDGKGGFDAGVEYAAGTAPGNVLLKDLSGHGRLDLVVTDSATGAIDVLRGNGDGTFEKPESFAAIADPIAIAAGKFTGGESTDLAVASATGLAVLTNDGGGHFSPASTVRFNHPAVSLAVADLKGVGHDDLVAANADGTATVLLSDGNGHFKTLAAAKVGDGPLAAIVAGDFNHDGRADLAVIQPGSNTLTVLLGRGDGTFDPGVDYAVGNGPASLIAADLKGKGELDLIAVNKAENTFSVLEGRGDGTFKPAVDYTAGNSPIAIAAGDFNGDGHADFAVLNSGDLTISLPLGRGDATFEAAPSYRTELEQKAIATGDLNGDGRADLVVTNFCGNDRGCKSNGTADVLLANADGTYRHASTYPLGKGPVAVALADLNGDKKLDMIAINRDDKTLTVMPGLGKGKFGEPQTYSLTGSPRALFVGDFNGDGKPDVAIATDCGRTTCSDPGNLDIWLGKGEGMLKLSASYTVGYSPDSIAAGDLRGTGHLDLLVANRCGDLSSCKSHGTASLLKGDGKGKFADGGEIELGNAPASIAIGSLTGKGLDLVVANRGSDELAVLHGDGKGGFAAPATYKVGSEPTALAIADFNGDGRPDIAITNFRSSTVSVLYGTARGALKSPITLPVGAGPESLVAVSNGKGAPSGLVTANGNSGAAPMGADVTALLHFHADVLPTPPMTLTAAPSPDTVNTSVTLTATVTGTAPNAPTAANVSFSSMISGPITCGAGSTNNEDSGTGITTVTCVTSALQAGSDTITASFATDANYSKNSKTTSLTIAALDTTTTLTTSGTPSNVNAAVTFKATVSASSTSPISPTGKVTFTSDGVNIPDCGTNGVIDLPGTAPFSASCKTTSLAFGSHSVIAVYSGDGNFNGSSNFVTQNVNAIASTITLTSSSGPSNPPPNNPTSTINQSVTFSAQVGPIGAADVALSGAVTFTDNGGPVAGCTVSFSTATGVASCTTSSLAVGASHVIKATYADDSSYTSSSDSLTQSVNQGTVTVGLGASPSSPAVNNPVTITATITPSPTGSVTPNGYVEFDDTPPGGSLAVITNCAAVSVVPNSPPFQAQCQTSSLILGAHTITATYKGDTNFKTNSNTLPLTVSKASGTIMLISMSTTSGNPSLPTSSVNQPATFKATLPAPPGNATLSGTVQFTDTPSGGATTTLCAGVLPTAGLTASCTTSALTASGTTPATAITHVITAIYSSNDPNFSLSNGTVTQRVNPPTTTVTVSSSSPGTPPTSTVNASVTFTATIAASFGTTPVAPTGSVAFSDSLTGGITNCSTQSLSSNGGSIQATCTTAALGVGAQTVTAAYTGDGNFPGNSGTVQQQVNAAATTVQLTSSAANPTVNQPVTFTAFIPVTSGNATLSGTVAFTDTPANGTRSTIPACGAVPVNPPVSGSQSTSWTATCIDSTLIVTGSPHTITATFTSNNSNFNVTPVSISQPVSQAKTNVTLTSSQNPNTVNELVTFTATVAAIPTGKVPLSGTVAFTDSVTNAVIPGCSAVALTVVGGDTIATCPTSTLTVGPHKITATYGNDTNFTGSSNSFVQTETPAVSTIALSSSVNPSTVNESVTFLARITAPSVTQVLIGKVEFTDNSKPIATCPAATPTQTAGTTTWTATCTDQALTAGNHAIVASYSGDTNLSVGNGSLPQTVDQAATTTVATSSANPSFVTNPKNKTDVVVLTATVTAGAGPVALSGSITFTDNGNAITNCSGLKVNAATGTATCTPPLPGMNITTLTSGANTILAQYSGDPNFSNSSNGNNLLIQNVQDFSLAISSAPPVTISQGYTTTSDNFTPQTISVAPVPIASFATAADDPLSLICTVADLPGETGKAPACKLYVLGSTSAGSTLPVASSGAQQSLGVLIDATNADPGDYTVTVTGTDPTTGLVHSAQFPVGVRFLSSPLSFQSGATTGNSGNVNFVLPPKVTLSGMACLYIAGTGITSTTEAPGKLGISCSITPATLGTSTATASQKVTATVAVSTNNTPTTAGLAKHTTLLIAGLFGIPIFGLMGFRRRRGTAAALFRLFAILAVSAAAFVPLGCGGSVHTTTPPTGGTTPPGEYFLLIQGQGSDHLTYSTVLQVDVEL